MEKHLQETHIKDRQHLTSFRVVGTRQPGEPDSLLFFRSPTDSDTTIIMLPRLTADATVDEIDISLEQLIATFRSAGPSRRWVVDCSALEQVPTDLLSAFIALEKKLRARGGSLTLCWLRDGVFPKKVMLRIAAALDLRKVGRFWFSGR